MSVRLLILSLLLCRALSAAEVFTGESLDVPFVIHGRLSAYNGNPALRIWVVGSKRVLGVSAPEGKEEEAMPKALVDIFRDGEGWFTREFYGDFTIEPLQPDQKGHMRPVRVLSVKNLVVVKEGKVVLMRKTL
jgi:hypothetical protein